MQESNMLIRFRFIKVKQVSPFERPTNYRCILIWAKITKIYSVIEMIVLQSTSCQVHCLLKENCINNFHTCLKPHVVTFSLSMCLSHAELQRASRDNAYCCMLKCTRISGYFLFLIFYQLWRGGEGIAFSIFVLFQWNCQHSNKNLNNF